MHILQIYKDYFPVLGGIENHLRMLSEGLAERGHQVTVLVTSLDGRTHREEPLPGLTILKAARAFHAASTPLSPAHMRLARDLRPDVIHLHFPYPPGDLAAFAAPGRPALVVTYHSDIVRQRTLRRVYRPLLELTLRRARRIITSNPAYITTSPVLRRFAAKCVVIPLAIDTDRFTPSAAANNNHILFVGRLRYYKGLHVLLEAMPRVQGELLIAGSGPEEARLRAQAAALGIAGRVTFLGAVAESALAPLYHSASVFVLPSHLRAEAFGQVLAEAMACGIPCVSTELGTGTSFVNLDGVTGLVVPPDDPAALTAAINRILGDPSLRQRYAAAARARVETLFGRDSMLTAIEAIYRDAVVSG